MSITNFIILINFLMFLQIDTISIYLRKYCIFSPFLVVENHNLMRLIVPNVCHVNVCLFL